MPEHIERCLQRTSQIVKWMSKHERSLSDTWILPQFHASDIHSPYDGHSHAHPNRLQFHRFSPPVSPKPPPSDGAIRPFDAETTRPHPLFHERNKMSLYDFTTSFFLKQNFNTSFYDIDVNTAHINSTNMTGSHCTPTSQMNLGAQAASNHTSMSHFTPVSMAGSNHRPTSHSTPAFNKASQLIPGPTFHPSQGYMPAPKPKVALPSHMNQAYNAGTQAVTQPASHQIPFPDSGSLQDSTRHDFLAKELHEAGMKYGSSLPPPHASTDGNSMPNYWFFMTPITMPPDPITLTTSDMSSEESRRIRFAQITANRRNLIGQLKSRNETLTWMKDRLGILEVWLACQ